MVTLPRQFHSPIPRYLVAGVCAYEAASIVTNKFPTVSSLCWTRRWLIPTVLVGLAVHLLRPPESDPWLTS